MKSRYLKFSFTSLCLSMVISCGSHPHLPVGDGWEEPTDSAPMSVVHVPTLAYAIDFGRGVNSLLGTAELENYRRCVQTDFGVPSGGFGGSELKMYMRQIKSNTEFFDSTKQNLALSINYSASQIGKAAAVAELAGSAEASSVSNRSFIKKVTDDSIFIELTISKDFQPFNVREAIVSEEDIAYFEKHSEDFFKICGDSYISGIQPGVRVQAIVQCKTKTIGQKMTMENEIKGKIGYGGTVASASAKEVIESVQRLSQNSCSIYFTASGGQETELASTDPATFLNSAITYVTKAPPAKAVPISISTSPYSTVKSVDFIERVLPKLNMEYAFQRSVAKMAKNASESAFQKVVDIDNVLFLKEGKEWPDREKWRKERIVQAQKAVDNATFFYRCASQLYDVNACINAE